MNVASIISLSEIRNDIYKCWSFLKSAKSLLLSPKSVMSRELWVKDSYHFRINVNAFRIVNINMRIHSVLYSFKIMFIYFETWIHATYCMYLMVLFKKKRFSNNSWHAKFFFKGKSMMYGFLISYFILRSIKECMMFAPRTHFKTDDLNHCVSSYSMLLWWLLGLKWDVFSGAEESNSCLMIYHDFMPVHKMKYNFKVLVLIREPFINKKSKSYFGATCVT